MEKIDVEVVLKDNNTLIAHFLLDTSSNVNLIKEEFIRDLKLDFINVNFSITSMGKKLTSNRCVTLELRINNVHIKEDFYVMKGAPLETDGNLSIHFLKKTKTILDFNNGKTTMHINGMEVLFESPSYEVFIPSSSQNENELKTKSKFENVLDRARKLVTGAKNSKKLKKHYC